MEGEKLTTNDEDELRELSHDDCIQCHWENCHDLGMEQMQLINWDSLGLALQQWPPDKQMWMANHLSRCSTVGCVMF